MIRVAQQPAYKGAQQQFKGTQQTQGFKGGVVGRRKTLLDKYVTVEFNTHGYCVDGLTSHTLDEIRERHYRRKTCTVSPAFSDTFPYRFPSSKTSSYSSIQPDSSDMTEPSSEPSSSMESSLICTPEEFCNSEASQFITPKPSPRITSDGLASNGSWAQAMSVVAKQENGSKNIQQHMGRTYDEDEDILTPRLPPEDYMLAYYTERDKVCDTVCSKIASQRSTFSENYPNLWSLSQPSQTKPTSSRMGIPNKTKVHLSERVADADTRADEWLRSYVGFGTKKTQISELAAVCDHVIKQKNRKENDEVRKVLRLTKDIRKT